MKDAYDGLADEYADVKEQLEKLEAKKEELREQIRERFYEQGYERVIGEDTILTLITRISRKVSMEDLSSKIQQDGLPATVFQSLLKKSVDIGKMEKKVKSGVLPASYLGLIKEGRKSMVFELLPRGQDIIGGE